MTLDEQFGELRSPERIMAWEKGRRPNSLCTVDIDTVSTLNKLRDCAQSQLLRSAAQTQNYLWIMDAGGTVKIAIEELALLDGKPDTRGFPRRRGYKHPSEDKKLGHPTLLDGDRARIAGELVLDVFDGELHWVFNAASGRYCREKPPTQRQIDAVADLIRKKGLEVRVDYL
jgi:hypothetical protein